MEALHIMTGIPISYNTLHYDTLHCLMQCMLVYWTLPCISNDTEYGNMVAAPLTCDVKLCVCRLVHHNAGNHNLEVMHV